MSLGLYDGFEGYRSVDEDTRAEAMRSWLIVLDTNVLLNLYNFQGKTLEEFIDVFAALGDRLFVPHQVLDEFWRNRLQVLKDNQGKHRERDQVEQGLTDVESAFRKWHQRVVDRLSSPDAEALRELQEAKQALLAHMDAHQVEGMTGPDTPTQADHVLTRLDPILAGRVGPAPSPPDRNKLAQDGRRRIELKVPPGYMDGEKHPDRAVGDFIVWHQTMAEAKSRSLSVLFVTNDQKEDWWADRGTAVMRARPELVAEMREVAGQRLVMVRSRDLIELGHLVGVQVSQSTLTEASLTFDADPEWSAELAESYLYFLSDWPDHFQVLREAIDAGGDVPRDRVAELLGKDPELGMKGSGKPFSTAVRRLVEYSELDVPPLVPLYAEYDSTSWMTHFHIPRELVSVFATALAVHDREYGSD